MSNFHLLSMTSDGLQEENYDYTVVYVGLKYELKEKLGIDSSKEFVGAFTNAFRESSVGHYLFVDNHEHLRKHVLNHLQMMGDETYQQFYLESKLFIQEAMSNSIHIINTYIYGGQWVFDDETRGLDKEPFVAGADTVIDIMSGHVDDPTIDKCTLIFSEIPFPTYKYKAVHKSSDDHDGNTYTFVVPHTDEPIMDFWLCPALLKFYDEAPKEIYVEVK